jgi:hypothetical protein
VLGKLAFRKPISLPTQKVFDLNRFLETHRGKFSAPHLALERRFPVYGSIDIRIYARIDRTSDYGLEP